MFVESHGNRIHLSFPLCLLKFPPFFGQGTLHHRCLGEGAIWILVQQRTRQQQNGVSACIEYPEIKKLLKSKRETHPEETSYQHIRLHERSGSTVPYSKNTNKDSDKSFKELGIWGLKMRTPREKPYSCVRS